MNLSSEILVVCDPRLRDAIESELVARELKYVLYVWTRGDGPGRRRLRTFLRSRPWGCILSVYNDYIFRPEDLQQATVAVNCHPALPDYPGMGYDILPLLHSRPRYGATAHRMIRRVDRGEVILTVEHELPAAWGYPELRRHNQLATLEAMNRILNEWSKATNPSRFDRRMSELAATAPQWIAPYVSRETLRRIVSDSLVNRANELSRLRIPEHF